MCSFDDDINHDNKIDSRAIYDFIIIRIDDNGSDGAAIHDDVNTIVDDNIHERRRQSR